MARDRSRSIEETRRLLGEREKELDAVYELASLFAQPGDSRDATLERTALILRASMQYPDLAVARVRTGTLLDEQDELVVSYRSERPFGIDQVVSVLVGYPAPPGALDEAYEILERERRLVASTVALLAKALDRMEIEQVLRESTRALQRQADELDQKNVALREILSQIRNEKERTLENARTHVAMFVEPYLHRLEARPDLDEEQRMCVRQILLSLRDLFSPEADRAVRVSETLTAREIEVCDLVRSGLATKEIASFLHISRTTVERHRNTIREKLGLTGKRVGLAAFLRRTDRADRSDHARTM